MRWTDDGYPLFSIVAKRLQDFQRQTLVSLCFFGKYFGFFDSGCSIYSFHFQRLRSVCRSVAKESPWSTHRSLK